LDEARAALAGKDKRAERGTELDVSGSTATPGSAWQLFISEPFNNTIAVINLTVFGTAPNQVFGVSSVSRISSPFLKLPVDLAPVKRDAEAMGC
jgi:hypothetical protein